MVVEFALLCVCVRVCVCACVRVLVLFVNVTRLIEGFGVEEII